jgi:HlyD family secretion protein
MPHGANKSRWVKVLVLLAILGAVSLALRFTLFRPEIVPVTVHVVGSGSVEDSVVNSRAGTVQSRLRSEMSPGISGLVVEIPARKGARVKKGEVLLRLNDQEHRAQERLASRSLEAARALAEQARLEAEFAQSQWKRSRDLASNNVVSETALDFDRTRALTSQAAVLAAQARIQEAEASLSLARATLEKTVITAPFDGVVLDVTTEVGEWISPSPPGVPIPPVLDLIDPNSLYVSAPIDEADVARIKVGQPARISLDAFRGRSFLGKLTYVSSFVETRMEQNRTLRVEAELDEAELPRNLFPGLSADLEIILEARANVLRIPTYALLEDSRVLLVQRQTLVERKVNTGVRNWNFTEITSGLAAGDRVVVSLDRPEVKAGARVSAKEEAEELK